MKQWVSSIQAGSAVGAEEELVDVLLFSVQLFGWFSAQAEPRVEPDSQYSWLSRHLRVGGATPALLTRRPALEKPCHFIHGQKAPHLAIRSECSCESDLNGFLGFLCDHHPDMKMQGRKPVTETYF